MKRTQPPPATGEESGNLITGPYSEVDKKRERAEKFKKLKQRRTAAAQHSAASEEATPTTISIQNDAKISEDINAPKIQTATATAAATAESVVTVAPLASLAIPNRAVLNARDDQVGSKMTPVAPTMAIQVDATQSAAEPIFAATPSCQSIWLKRELPKIKPKSAVAKRVSKLKSPINDLFNVDTGESERRFEIQLPGSFTADVPPKAELKAPALSIPDSAELSSRPSRRKTSAQLLRGGTASEPVSETQPMTEILIPAPLPTNPTINPISTKVVKPTEDSSVQTAAKDEPPDATNERHMIGVDDDDNAQGALDVYLDNDGLPVEDDYFTMLAKRGGGKELEIPDHSKISYDPMDKILYTESSEIRDLTAEEVELFRTTHQIRVKPKWLCPKPIKEFSQGGFADSVLIKLYSKDIIKPFPVQMQVLPCLMSGLNVLCVATTGSGKTLAYLLPMIRHCQTQEVALRLGEGPRGLILVPTRELATQIGRESQRYASPAGLVTNVLYGGGRLRDQLSASKRGCDILISTPGRLIEILTINFGRVMNLRKVHCVVLDEADRMFDLGFGPQIDRIIQNVRPDRQISMFSATFPHYMDYLAKSLAKGPTGSDSGGGGGGGGSGSTAGVNQMVEIYIGGRGRASSSVVQHLECFSFETEKFLRLLKLLGEWYEHGESIIIFCRGQSSVENLFVKLLAHGYPALALYGGQDQEEREMALIDFRKKTRTILIATSLASRGIDVKNVVLVINYEAPDHAQDYIHRVGRTGRAGNVGVAYTFFMRGIAGGSNPGDGDKAHDILPVAKESPDSEIDPEVEALAQEFMKQVEAGERKLFKKKSLAGTGFTFDPSEKSQQQQAKEFWKKELGIVPNNDEIEADARNLQFVSAEAQLEQTKAAFAESRVATLLEQWTASMMDPIARDAKKKLLDATVRRVVEQEMQRLEMTGGMAEALEKYKQHQSPIGPLDSPPSQQQSLTSQKRRQGSAIQQARRILNKVMAGASEQKIPRDYQDELTGNQVLHMSINDYPSQARQQVTQKDVLSSIADSTGSTINVRGRYSGVAGPPNRPDGSLFELHLEIVAPTMISARLAKQQLLDIVESEAKKTLR